MSGTFDAEERARTVLGPEVYAYFATGSGIEETVRANDEAWRQLYLRPRLLRDVSDVDPRTTLLGTPVAAPTGVAPTGFHQMAHPEGETATARGTAAAGSLYVLSTRSTRSFADVSSEAGPWWFQVYILRDRALTEKIVRQAADSGARALVLTADVPYLAAKARPMSALFDLATPLVPELDGRKRDEGIYQNPAVTLADIAWLKRISGDLPLVVKGVLRGDDAEILVREGADAVWVSNHGGRQLDGAIPTAYALGEVSRAVDGRAEVYVDGGVRTGRDIVRALALGARAAFVGRPVIWSLATGGADGVRALLTRLRDETTEAMALAGRATVAEVEAGDVTARPL